MTEPDDRISGLFRDAAADAPPAAFDHDLVVATSRRITARRRSAVLGGAMALLVVTGVGVAAALPSTGRDAASTAAAPAAAPAPEAVGPAPESADAQAEQAAPLAAPDTAAPDAARVPDALEGVPEFTGTPLGPGTTECAQRQDPQLRAYVEQALPEVVGAPEAAVTMDCRPGGERGVSLEVDDAGTAGLLTVQYLPPGEQPSTTGGASATAPTASGGTVIVSTNGARPGAAAPFAGRLDAAAAFLAPRL